MLQAQGAPASSLGTVPSWQHTPLKHSVLPRSPLAQVPLEFETYSTGTHSVREKVELGYFSNARVSVIFLLYSVIFLVQSVQAGLRLMIR